MQTTYLSRSQGYSGPKRLPIKVLLTSGEMTSINHDLALAFSSSSQSVLEDQIKEFAVRVTDEAKPSRPTASTTLVGGRGLVVKGELGEVVALYFRHGCQQHLALELRSCVSVISPSDVCSPGRSQRHGTLSGSNDIDDALTICLLLRSGFSIITANLFVASSLLRSPLIAS